jgi:hypothetical protein
MTDFINQLPRPANSILSKKNRMKITVYGPYGQFTNKLLKVTKLLRTKYGYKDCKLVKERLYRPKKKDEMQSTYWTLKSFHYLKESHVVIFIFFCDRGKEVAHNESPSIEIAHLIYKTDKISCCFVLIDNNCNMPAILKGILNQHELKLDEFNGYDKKCEVKLANLLQAKCLSFLKEKYDQIE